MNAKGPHACEPLFASGERHVYPPTCALPGAHTIPGSETMPGIVAHLWTACGEVTYVDCAGDKNKAAYFLSEVT